MALQAGIEEAANAQHSVQPGRGQSDTHLDTVALKEIKMHLM